MNIHRYIFGKAKRPKTVGSHLVVGLPQLGIAELKAKVDTGATSGALHASDIKEVVGADGSKELQFMPYSSEHEVVTVSSYHKRKVKSSNGEASVRFAFDAEIVILGDPYLITLTLADRSNMKYPMLIGRRFLREHGFLVDVSLHNK